jgi:hypothetical protein
MVQVQNLIRQEIASVRVPVLNWSEQPLHLASAGPDRGFITYFSPLDYIEAIQSVVKMKDYTRKLLVIPASQTEGKEYDSEHKNSNQRFSVKQICSL